MSVENLFLDGVAGDDDYFWTRPKVYANERKIPVLNIPVWRTVNFVLIIYSLYIGIDYIGGLCTKASKFTLSVSLIACILYWTWATWWDERYMVPPTWSALKMQRFNPFWIMLWLTYNAIMISFAMFLVIATLVLTYADYQEVFKWQCWDWASWMLFDVMLDLAEEEYSHIKWFIVTFCLILI